MTSGSIDVSVAGHLSLLQGGVIDSGSHSGDAGSVRVVADSISIDRQNFDLLTAIIAGALPGSVGNAGDVTVVARGLLSIAGGGGIVSNTASIGDAGSVRVSAGDLLIDGSNRLLFPSAIQATSLEGATGNAGSVEVDVAGNLIVVSMGTISSVTHTPGRGGLVKVHARNIYLDGAGSTGLTGISTQTDSSSGPAGDIEVSADGELSIVRGAEITSGTFAGGRAGSVKVSAASAFLDGGGSTIFTGISSESTASAGAPAGHVEVSIRGDLIVANQAVIQSDTFSSSNAGDVVVSAGGTLALFNGGRIGSSTFAGGDAGPVKVDAGSMIIDGSAGIMAVAARAGSGSGGDITVDVAGDLSIFHGGQISAVTNSPENAGAVKIHAGSMHIEGPGGNVLTGATSGTFLGSGNAGDVAVSVDGALAIVFGEISSNSIRGTGRAGSVTVSAGDISIVGGRGGVAAVSDLGGGDAGNVSVTARGNISLSNGGAITANTLSINGQSGSVTVHTASLLVDGSESSVSAFASNGSSGQTGTVSVDASRCDHAHRTAVRCRFENDATVAHPEARCNRRLLSVSRPASR